MNHVFDESVERKGKWYSELYAKDNDKVKSKLKKLNAAEDEFKFYSIESIKGDEDGSEYMDSSQEEDVCEERDSFYVKQNYDDGMVKKTIFSFFNFDHKIISFFPLCYAFLCQVRMFKTHKNILSVKL
jgi:hypothetical protein